MDELLTKVCGRVNEMRSSDQSFPNDYGKFGSLCLRHDAAFRRLDAALKEYLEDTGNILRDLQCIHERDGKVDLTKCVGCGAVMNGLVILDTNPFCPPCVKKINAKPKSKRSK